MAEQSVTLAPGMVTTISTGIVSGTTVYNGDPAAAVWVSANPTPGPTSGMRIGPKGSLSWTSGGPLYGAVDPGVVSPVVLTLSSNVGSLVNPVDVGAAVAAQLLAQGVPSVFQGDVIASGDGLPVIAAGNYGVTGLDVSRFASLVITINTMNTGQVSATCTAPGGGNLGSFDFPVSRSGASITFTIPVTGPLLSFTLASSQNTNSYTIYGSNRAVPAPRVLNGYSRNTLHAFFDTAFTAGIQNPLPDAFISNGKPCFIRMVVTGAGVGKFGYVGFDAAGTEEIVDLIDSAIGITGTDGKEIETIINLPPGCLQLYWYPATTATYTVAIALVQEF